jgi:hypothetical protein
MLGDVNLDVEIARPAAPSAVITFIGHHDTVPVIDSGRHLDFDELRPRQPTDPSTVGTELTIPNSRTAAVGAWLGKQHEATRLSGSPSSLAGLASVLPIGRDLSPALAGPARNESIDPKSSLDSLEGLFKGNTQSMPQIFSVTAHLRTIGSRRTSKNFGEDVRILVPRESEIEPLETVTLLLRFRFGFGLLAVTVVTLSLLRTGQDLKGFADTPVVDLGRPIAGVDIGVILPRQPPEGTLELGLFRRTPNP